MSARRYLAWDMLAAAAYEDERRDQRNFQASMRKCLGNSLEHLSDNNFIKQYRLNKEAFEDLRDLLAHYTDLKSSQRVSLESKLSSSAKIDRWFSLLPGNAPALSRPESGFVSGVEDGTDAATWAEVRRFLLQFGAKKKRRLLPIRFTRKKTIVNKHTLL